MTYQRPRSTTDKFAIVSFTALVLAVGLRIAVTPEVAHVVPETGALIESRLPDQHSIPLAQVLATQVHIERLMAAGIIKDKKLDQAFYLLEQSSHAVDGFVTSKGMNNAEDASLKMIRPEANATLYDQYKDMSALIEQHQPDQ